jgi:hypothetical protein
MKEYETMDLPRTKVVYEDTWPVVGPKTTTQYARSPVLGVLLTPRLKTVMTVWQAKEWDYVLRHMFVLQAQPVEVALPLLGFNAISLLKDIGREDDVFTGRPVNPKAIVRDLEVDEWARIVDVFANWPFKPAVSLSGRLHLRRADGSEPRDGPRPGRGRYVGPVRGIGGFSARLDARRSSHHHTALDSYIFASRQYHCH